jgi:hypothetical protein
VLATRGADLEQVIDDVFDELGDLRELELGHVVALGLFCSERGIA